jgi:hypothetical protein
LAGRLAVVPAGRLAVVPAGRVAAFADMTPATVRAVHAPAVTRAATITRRRRGGGD